MSLGLLAVTGSARAQGAWPVAIESGPKEEMLEFDIPVQPLASALDQFATVSHQSVLFSDELVDGRSAASVHGRYTPLAALHALLAGTGLTADNVGGSQDQVAAFVLKATTSAAPDAPPDEARTGSRRRYDGVVQARVWQTLCADPRTAPGDYRTMLRFQVDTSGQLRQLRLLASTGDGRRDAAMLSALSKLRIDQLPSDLPQPLTLMILPLDAIAQARICQQQPVP
jgi:hypothetical protein